MLKKVGDKTKMIFRRQNIKIKYMNVLKIE